MEKNFEENMGKKKKPKIRKAVWFGYIYPNQIGSRIIRQSYFLSKRCEKYCYNGLLHFFSKKLWRKRTRIKFGFLFGLGMGLFSCESDAKNESKNNVEVITILDSVQMDEIILTPIDKPKNVITSEFWENFDTDIEIVILFTKGDSLTKTENEVFIELKKEFGTLEFQEFYTDDKVAQVFINDTLVFDITPFLIQHEKGLVLMKPFFQPTFKSLEQPLEEVKKYFHEFYENK